MRFYVTTRAVFGRRRSSEVFDGNGNVLEKALGIDDGQYHQSSTIWIRVRKVATVFRSHSPQRFEGNLLW